MSVSVRWRTWKGVQRRPSFLRGVRLNAQQAWPVDTRGTRNAINHHPGSTDIPMSQSRADIVDASGAALAAAIGYVLSQEPSGWRNGSIGTAVPQRPAGVDQFGQSKPRSSSRGVETSVSTVSLVNRCGRLASTTSDAGCIPRTEARSSIFGSVACRSPRSNWLTYARPETSPNASWDKPMDARALARRPASPRSASPSSRMAP